MHTSFLKKFFKHYITHCSDLKKLIEKFEDEMKYKQQVEKCKHEVQIYMQETMEYKVQVEKHKHNEQHYKTISERLDSENKRYQNTEEK